MLKTTGPKHSARIQGGLFADGECFCERRPITLVQFRSDAPADCVPPVRLYSFCDEPFQTAHCGVSSVCH